MYIAGIPLIPWVYHGVYARYLRVYHGVYARYRRVSLTVVYTQGVPNSGVYPRVYLSVYHAGCTSVCTMLGVPCWVYLRLSMGGVYLRLSMGGVYLRLFVVHHEARTTGHLWENVHQEARTINLNDRMADGCTLLTLTLNDRMTGRVTTLRNMTVP